MKTGRIRIILLFASIVGALAVFFFAYSADKNDIKARYLECLGLGKKTPIKLNEVKIVNTGSAGSTVFLKIEGGEQYLQQAGLINTKLNIEQYYNTNLYNYINEFFTENNLNIDTTEKYLAMKSYALKDRGTTTMYIYSFIVESENPQEQDIVYMLLDMPDSIMNYLPKYQ